MGPYLTAEGRRRRRGAPWHKLATENDSDRQCEEGGENRGHDEVRPVKGKTGVCLE